MKRGLRLMVLVLASASIVGCASMQKESAYAPQVRPTSVVEDAQYVAKVEQFWGFPTTGSHTFLVARRVLPVAGEKVRTAKPAKGVPAWAAQGSTFAAGSIG